MKKIYQTYWAKVVIHAEKILWKEHQYMIVGFFVSSSLNTEG